jgi:hypothetical protein
MIEESMVTEILKINDPNNPYNIKNSNSNYNIVKIENKNEIEDNKITPLEKKEKSQEKFQYTLEDLEKAKEICSKHQYHNMKTIRQTYHKMDYNDKNISQMVKEFKINESLIPKQFIKAEFKLKNIENISLINSNINIALGNEKDRNFKCKNNACKSYTAIKGVKCSNHMCAKHCKVAPQTCERHKKKN